MGFIFGGNTGGSSPEELEQRRALVRALAAQSVDKVPQNPWEGLNSLAEAIGQRIEQDRLDEAEQQGRASAGSAFAPLTQAVMNKKTPNIGMLTGVLSNPWLNPSQRSLAQTYLDQQLIASQPLTPHQQAQLQAEHDRIAADNRETAGQPNGLRYYERTDSHNKINGVTRPNDAPLDVSSDGTVIEKPSEPTLDEIDEELRRRGVKWPIPRW